MAPRTVLVTVVLFGLLGLILGQSENCDAFDKVNVFMGTGGPGFGYGGINPGAQYPYSPLRLGPDSITAPLDIGFRHFSGYHYLDKMIRGFSHMHLVGAGVNDLGTIGVMPFRVSPKKEDEFNFDPSEQNATTRVWWSKFDKATETATPGQYNVYLDTPKVQANLLAIGEFAAVHKYKFDAVDEHGIPAFLVDMCHAAQIEDGFYHSPACLNASVTINAEESTFTGSVYFHGGLSHQIWVHIYGEIDVVSPRTQKVKKWKTCTGRPTQDTCTDTTTETMSSTSGALFSILSFDPLQNEISKGALELELRVGMSFIDPTQAKKNLQSSLEGTSKQFTDLAERTKSTWCKTLNGLDLVALDGDTDVEAIVQSARYHSAMSPTILTEAGGVYLGLDKQVHNATADREAVYGPANVESNGRVGQAYQFYSDLSLWDTFRTQHPWLLLTNENLAVGILRSTAEMTVQQNAFPRWVLANNEASCMIGAHGSALALEAVNSGLSDQFDVVTIQKTLQIQSTQNVPLNGRDDIDHYMAEGYCSQETSDVATSLTLSYAFDDFLLAGLSKFVGDTDSATSALKRSHNYRNVWSREHQLFCPRYLSGELECPVSAIGPKSWTYFKEGNALHWLWYVPHDPQGLINLFPSAEAFDNKLTAFFDNHVEYHEKFGSAVPNPYYWAGNEHDLLAPYMFNYGPNCTKTQYWSRRLTHMHFSNTPHGVPGNDDYAATSGWVLFSTLGIYPQAGTTNYLIGSPRVSSAIINLQKFGTDQPDSVLKIVTYNNSPDNVYVQKLVINGVQQSSPIIDRSLLVQNGGVTLEFYMQAEPESSLCAAV